MGNRRAIVFADLTPALLAGAKTCIRLEWDEAAALKYRRGDVVEVYDQTPRSGGQAVAVIKLTADPELLPMSSLTIADYDAEGWAWMAKHPRVVPTRRYGKRQHREAFSKARYDEWSRQKYSRWVIRFRLVRVLADQRASVAS